MADSESPLEASAQASQPAEERDSAVESLHKIGKRLAHRRLTGLVDDIDDRLTGLGHKFTDHEERLDILERDLDTLLDILLMTLKKSKKKHR